MHPTPPGEGLRAFVYTKPRCRQCVATARRLKLAGVPVHLIGLDTAPEVLAYAREAGFTQAPVVLGVRGDGTSVWWSGLNLERIDEFADLAADARDMEVRDA